MNLHLQILEIFFVFKLLILEIQWLIFIWNFKFIDELIENRIFNLLFYILIWIFRLSFFWEPNDARLELEIQWRIAYIFIEFDKNFISFGNQVGNGSCRNRAIFIFVLQNFDLAHVDSSYETQSLEKCFLIIENFLHFEHLFCLNPSSFTQFNKQSWIFFHRLFW